MIEKLLEGAVKGVDVVMINRGVSGELAANAAHRMQAEVALNEPDLVLWQVGTNDALAYVPVAEVEETVRDAIEWLHAHKVDVILVGLQFVDPRLRDAHYIAVRDGLRALAAKENVIMLRRDEAMQIIGQTPDSSESFVETVERNEASYSCLAQYVARAITLARFRQAPCASSCNRRRRRRGSKSGVDRGDRHRPGFRSLPALCRVSTYFCCVADVTESAPSSLRISAARCRDAPRLHRAARRSG